MDTLSSAISALPQGRAITEQTRQGALRWKVLGDTAQLPKKTSLSHGAGTQPHSHTTPLCLDSHHAPAACSMHTTAHGPHMQQ